MNRRALFRLVYFYIFIVFLFLSGTFLGNKVITVLSGSHQPIEKHLIIIDAGHGGEDGGAISCTGKYESQYNLSISLRLRDLLQLLGYNTIMVRTTDTSVYTSGSTIAQRKVSDLKERVRIANSYKNALLVSIHQNYFQESKYSGAQVFYSNQNGSKQLAEMLQNSFITILNPGSHREEKRGEGIYLLEKVQCPGILVECGFISNPNEERLLLSAQYQKSICAVISATVSSYLCKNLTDMV